MVQHVHVRSWLKTRRDGERRRDEEALRLAREQLAVANADSRTNRRLQSVMGVLTAISIAIAIFAWQPWAHPDQPRASIRLLPSKHSAVIPKPIQEISAPPRYAQIEQSNHCGAWWRAWFRAQNAVDVVPPTIELSAPTTASVSVTGASVRVFRSYLPRTLSYVMCLHGAGPRPGTLLHVDLANAGTAPTIVADDGSETALAIPNAVITVEAGDTEFVVITPAGAPRLYEWSVTLRFVVAQRTQTQTFGSAERPLRTWLGRTPEPSYDYDFGAQTWMPRS